MASSSDIVPAKRRLLCENNSDTDFEGGSSDEYVPESNASSSEGMYSTSSSISNATMHFFSLV